ncbi:MAG: hypothetical protein HZA04_06470 [Nitrospinae bacterium]|nr:hypothetical protein [Nitrospinota bacterium]
MKRAFALLAAVAVLGFGGKAFATPSTQIWIPSTDVQGFSVVHLGVDTYNTPFKGQTNGANTEGGHNVINYGLTVGVLPNDEKFGLEVGVDYRDFSLGGAKNPLLLNAKLGVKEGAFGEAMPAIAVGGYDFGTKSSSSATDAADFRTDYNITYGLLAKSFESIGRISVGYFSGNDKVLLDHNGDKANTGLLASWDKSLSDKWWAAIDYMGGNSAYGALSFGICYYVTPGASMIFGYDIYNDKDIGGKNLNGDTFTFQLDVNFDALSHPHHD